MATRYVGKLKKSNRFWSRCALISISPKMILRQNLNRLSGSGLTEFMTEEKLIDEQANYRLVNQNRLGKTDRPPGQPLDARS